MGRRKRRRRRQPTINPARRSVEASSSRRGAASRPAAQKPVGPADDRASTKKWRPSPVTAFLVFIALTLVSNLATNTVKVSWRWWPVLVWVALIVLVVMAAVIEFFRADTDSASSAGATGVPGGRVPSVRAVMVLLAGFLLVGIVLVVVLARAVGASGVVWTLVRVLVGVAALATLVVMVVVVGMGVRRQPGERFSDRNLVAQKTRLALQVSKVWSPEWNTRMPFPPLTVSWAAASEPVSTMPVAAAPRTGRAADLVARFAKLPPHAQRLVVTGGGGSGKTILALQVTLETIRSVTDWAGPNPVPVYVPAGGWNPTSQKLRAWLVQQITQSYEGFDTVIIDDKDDKPKTIAGFLFDHGAILPVLDGLDEMGPQKQAVDALIAIGGPFVLTSRVTEFERVVEWLKKKKRHFEKTTIVELQPLTADGEVVDYISAGASSAHAGGWAKVKDLTGRAPNGPLARALSTPLMVALARAVYGSSSQDPEPLLKAPDVESYLLESFFGTVYDAGLRAEDRQERERKPPYHLGQKPLRWLEFLAAHIKPGQTESPGLRSPSTLAWWELRLFAWPFVLEACWGVLAGVLLSLLVGLMGWHALGLVVGPVLGLLFGAGFDLVYATLRQAQSPDRAVGGFRGVPDPLTIGRRLGDGLLVIIVALATGSGLLTLVHATGWWSVPAAPPLQVARGTLGLVIAIFVTILAGMVIGSIAGASLRRTMVEKRFATIRVATPQKTLSKDRFSSFVFPCRACWTRRRQSSRASPARRTTWKGSITATASGSSSVVAVLNPVNPSIATTSMPSRQPWWRAASQVLNTAFDRPGTMSSSLPGPVLSRTGVRSMITVTYLSPSRV